MAESVLLDPRVLAVLAETFEDSPDVMDMVIRNFLDSVARLHSRINVAITIGDVDDMTMAAHSLKSNCATVGAIAMAEAMRDIERIGRTGDMAGCPELLALSERTYLDVRPLLEEMLGGDERAHGIPGADRPGYRG